MSEKRTHSEPPQKRSQDANLAAVERAERARASQEHARRAEATRAGARRHRPEGKQT